MGISKDTKRTKWNWTVKKGVVKNLFEKMGYEKYFKLSFFQKLVRTGFLDATNEESIKEFDLKVKKAVMDFQIETFHKIPAIEIKKTAGSRIYDRILSGRYEHKCTRIQEITSRIIGLKGTATYQIFVDDDINFIKDFVSNNKQKTQTAKGTPKQARNQLIEFLQLIPKIRPKIATDTENITVDGYEIQEYRNEFGVTRYKMIGLNIDLSDYINYEKNPYKKCFSDKASRLIEKLK